MPEFAPAPIPELRDPLAGLSIPPNVTPSEANSLLNIALTLRRTEMESRAAAVRYQGMMEYQQALKAGLPPDEALRVTAPKMFYRHPEGMATAIHQMMPKPKPILEERTIGDKTVLMVNGIPHAISLTEEAHARQERAKQEAAERMEQFRMDYAEKQAQLRETTQRKATLQKQHDVLLPKYKAAFSRWQANPKDKTFEAAKSARAEEIAPVRQELRGLGIDLTPEPGLDQTPQGALASGGGRTIDKATYLQFFKTYGNRADAVKNAQAQGWIVPQ